MQQALNGTCAATYKLMKQILQLLIHYISDAMTTSSSATLCEASAVAGKKSKASPAAGKRRETTTRSAERTAKRCPGTPRKRPPAEESPRLRLRLPDFGQRPVATAASAAPATGHHGFDLVKWRQTMIEQYPDQYCGDTSDDDSLTGDNVSLPGPSSRPPASADGGTSVVASSLPEVSAVDHVARAFDIDSDSDDGSCGVISVPDSPPSASRSPATMAEASASVSSQLLLTC